MRNDMAYDITINTDDSYTYDAAGFVLISQPQRGIYIFDGMGSSVAITSVTVNQSFPLTSAGGTFQMVDFQSDYPPTTTVGGDAQIIIGATARTSGTGVPYADFTYSGTVDITINF